MDNIIFNLNFSRIWWIIKKKLFAIVFIAVLGATAMGAYGYCFSYTNYMARVSFYVMSNPSYLSESQVNVSSSEFAMAQNLVPSYMLVLKSNTVMQKIIENLGLEYTASQIRGMISSSSVEDTAVFYVYVLASDPYQAMNIANAIAEVAPAEIARVVKSGGIEVIDYATLPTEPYNTTNLLKYILIGGVLGFGCSLIFFIIIGLLNSTIRNKAELEKVFTIPVIGEVPIILASSRKTKAQTILSSDSNFALKETYNILRTNLMFIGENVKCPVYAVSSCSQGNGKTMNCINMAISFTQIGRSVLIIDADLRRPSVLKQMNVKNSDVGLSQFLAGIEKSISITHSPVPNLDIIGAGLIPPNAGDLLATSRFSDLITDMSKKYDCIFIDTPPIGIVSDAVLVSKYVTGYILVVRSDSSKITEEKEMVQQLEQVDANICGFIFNAIEPKKTRYYSKKNNYKY